MIKLKTLFYFFAISTSSIVSGVVVAETDIYGSCGTKPSALDRLFSNADKIREKCIEDIYQENKEKTRLEIEELASTSATLNLEIKKVSIKSSIGLVQCAPESGETKRDPSLIKQCEELIKAKNAIIDRTRELTGWNDTVRVKEKNPKEVEKSITPPCPSDNKLSNLRVVATFNRKLFKTWEYCRLLMIDSM